MSMTREEAFKKYEEWRNLGFGHSTMPPSEVLVMAMNSLRPITRERLEKVWRGEWIAYLDGEHIMPERYYSCSKCGDRGYPSKRNFCDFCGAPMTDEAVDMVMERLEEMMNER